MFYYYILVGTGCFVSKIVLTYFEKKNVLKFEAEDVELAKFTREIITISTHPCYPSSFDCKTGILTCILHIYGPHFLCWVSVVVPFNMLLISSWEGNKCCQLTKWPVFSLKMTTSTILSETDVILWICSACWFSSKLEISHVLNGTAT